MPKKVNQPGIISTTPRNPSTLWSWSDKSVARRVSDRVSDFQPPLRPGVRSIAKSEPLLGMDGL